jgi:hypothetical protein
MVSPLQKYSTAGGCLENPPYFPREDFSQYREIYLARRGAN